MHWSLTLLIGLCNIMLAELHRPSDVDIFHYVTKKSHSLLFPLTSLEKSLSTWETVKLLVTDTGFPRLPVSLGFITGPNDRKLFSSSRDTHCTRARAHICPYAGRSHVTLKSTRQRLARPPARQLPRSLPDGSPAFWAEGDRVPPDVVRECHYFTAPSGVFLRESSLLWRSPACVAVPGTRMPAWQVLAVCSLLSVHPALVRRHC